MKIEVVEAYIHKEEKNFISGTIHIYLIDHDFDIRGISFVKKKNHWRFYLPFKKTIDKDTNQPVIYPCFSFTDKAKQREMMSQIIKQGREYISKNLLTNTKSPAHR